MLRVETTNLPIPRGAPRSRRLLPNPPSPKRRGVAASRHEMLPPRDDEASDVTETVSLASPATALAATATLTPAAPLVSDRWSVRLELADDDIAKLYGQGMTRGAVVWRKGMHEWRPLLITPELSGLLRRTRTTLSETPPVPYVSEELTVPRPARLPSDFPAVEESIPPSSDRPRFTTVAPTALDIAVPERSTKRRRVELAAVAVAAFALAWLTHGRLQSSSPPPATTQQAAAAVAAAPAPAPACEPTQAPHAERAGSSGGIPTVAVADLPLVGQKGAASEPTASLAPSRGATTSVAASRGASARSTRSDPSRPSRAELSSALSRVAGAASGCGERGGPVRVMMTFAPSGVARSIQVSGAGLPAQTRSCIFGAASRARVPAFSGDPVTVSKTL